MAEVLTAEAGSTIVTTLVDPGVEYLGARIEVPVTREIVSFWTEATLDGSSWVVALDAPLSTGGYLLVWRTGDPEPPEYEIFLPLQVVAVGASIAPAGSIDPALEPFHPERELVTPTVDDVAALERTRTIAEGNTEEVTFTEATRPTYSDVEDLIEQAVDLVLSELPMKFPKRHYDSVQRAAALYAAVLVEGSFHREQSEAGSSSLWRTLYNTAILNLQRQIASDLAEWRKVRRMEPSVIV